MSESDAWQELWWIRDNSPQPNDDAPKKMCRVCMRHPVGFTDGPDPNCQMCQGRGTMPQSNKPVTVNIQTNTGDSWSELAGNTGVSSGSSSEAVQITWHSSGF